MYYTSTDLYVTDRHRYYKERYLYEELTREIIGLIFETYNELGFGYQEKVYQRGFTYKLENKKIPFQKEQYGVIKIDGKPIARYYIDIVVEKKVAVEMKVANEFFNTYVQQVLHYLKASGLKIGLLCLITKDGVKVKRLIR